MSASSGYVLELLRESGDFHALPRGRQHGNPSPVLAVALAAEMPSPESLRRIEREYSIAAKLGPRGQRGVWPSLRHEGWPLLVLRESPTEELVAGRLRDWRSIREKLLRLRASKRTTKDGQ